MKQMTSQRLMPVLVFIFAVICCGNVTAQETNTWIQVEARPTEEQARARASDYQQLFDDVAGFQLRSGWYAIVLGPYSQPEATQRLATLKATGQIPPDSYVQFDQRLGAAFVTPKQTSNQQ